MGWEGCEAGGGRQPALTYASSPSQWARCCPTTAGTSFWAAWSSMSSSRRYPKAWPPGRAAGRERLMQQISVSKASCPPRGCVVVLGCGCQPLGASWRSSVATGWLAAVGFHTGRILLNDSKQILLWGGDLTVRSTQGGCLGPWKMQIFLLKRLGAKGLNKRNVIESLCCGGVVRK